MTGGGISSGLDESLEIICRIAGPDVAKRVQTTTQYFPEPPVQKHNILGLQIVLWTIYHYEWQKVVRVCLTSTRSDSANVPLDATA